MPPPPETCANCLYFLPATLDTYATVPRGACRRYPPTMPANPAGSPEGTVNDAAHSHFPLVDAAWWCGEWRPTVPPT